MHAEQAIACMDAGKHVQVEIPLSDSWADALAVEAKAKETGLTCMVGHTRRFNPCHQYVKQQIDAVSSISRRWKSRPDSFGARKLTPKARLQAGPIIHVGITTR